MAKYDRKLLVPYLQDVCSVELLLHKVQREYNLAADKNLTYRMRVESDVPPSKPEEDGTYWWLPGIIGLVLAFIALTLIYDPTILKVLIALVLGFLSFMAFVVTFDELQNLGAYNQKHKKYLSELKAYNERNATRYKNQELVVSWKKEMDIRARRVAEIKRLRETIYSANVIPLPYRNVYAVHFLYDYFRTSSADDVDMILQTFVLEEIKTKLDSIIQQQTEIILNQRVMIANQEKMNATLAKNHEEKMRQLAYLNENAERRNQYLEMINTNLKISNFFAYHDYINK